VFLFAPFITQLNFDAVAKEAKLPESKSLSASNYTKGHPLHYIDQTNKPRDKLSMTMPRSARQKDTHLAIVC
jgi:hypothetical protein